MDADTSGNAIHARRDCHIARELASHRSSTGDNCDRGVGGYPFDSQPIRAQRPSRRIENLDLRDPLLVRYHRVGQGETHRRNLGRRAIIGRGRFGAAAHHNCCHAHANYECRQRAVHHAHPLERRRSRRSYGTMREATVTSPLAARPAVIIFDSPSVFSPGTTSRCATRLDSRADLPARCTTRGGARSLRRRG